MQRVTALVVCALLAGAAPATSQDGPRADLTSLSRGAERVLVATVVRVDPVRQSNEFGDQLIVSRLHVRVDTVLKGSRGPAAAPHDQLVVEVEGGTIGDLTLTVSDMPRLERGERAVLFLRQNGRGAFVPHNRGHGILELDSSDRVRGRALTLSDVRRAVEQAR